MVPSCRIRIAGSYTNRARIAATRDMHVLRQLIGGGHSDEGGQSPHTELVGDASAILGLPPDRVCVRPSSFPLEGDPYQQSDFALTLDKASTATRT